MGRPHGRAPNGAPRHGLHMGSFPLLSDACCLECFCLVTGSTGVGYEW